MNDTTYISPLSSRYASKELLRLFSLEKRYILMRELWIALAESEKHLGLDITDEQIAELKHNKTNINFKRIEELESELRHDVMANIHAYGEQCPKAKGIIHLGATSAYVQDNADLIIQIESLKILRKKMLNVMSNLKQFALKYKDQPTLGFTHFQPAQLTTVGKRATLWLQDLLIDFEQLEHISSYIMFRGVKGTTGTQASFMSLFNNDEEKVKELDELVSTKMGFKRSIYVSGQTYTRKQDTLIGNVLSGIAESANKFATDIRLLSNLKEIEEPFESKQIGSSAMAYKRNPMRCERICSLSRFVISLNANHYQTHSTQWFERTLDDSANRRLTISEMFLTVDAILNVFINVTSGLNVFPKIIENRLEQEIPFMATENIIMEAVKKGGDRQALHEEIRVLSHKVTKSIKLEGTKNNLLELIANSPIVPLNIDEINQLLSYSNFIGRAPNQTQEFITNIINPILDKNSSELGLNVELSV